MSDSGNGSTSDEFTVLLEGGRPWGFTLQGGADFRSPLKIGKVTVGGRAQKSGLLSGDIITTVNGIATAQMKHHEAQRLISSSKTTLELVCTKAVQLSSTFSPKSVTQDSSFDFPVTMGANEKSMTLGNRHIRQASLDLNPRPRSRSDAGKKATVGAKIAGIIVPPPPPSVKNARKLSEPEIKKQEGPIKAIAAGIVVPSPPPKVNGTSTGTSNESSTDSVITNEGDNSLDVITNVSSPTPVILMNEEIIINETVDTPKEKEPEIISYNIEFNNFHEVPNDSNGVISLLPQDCATVEEESELESADKESLEDDSTFVAADTIASGDGEKSPEIVKPRENDDWYKSMFQIMKKGVEEDIPDKKPVWDRSPVPHRKPSHEFESKTSPNYKYKNTSYGTSPQRRFSESSLPSSITSSSYNPLKQSSSGSNIGGFQKADVVSEVGSGVVYQKNVKRYNTSRNYWKSIERQASQERIELETKRNSLRRSSSASSTGKLNSPDALNTTEDSSKPQNHIPTAFFKEEVVGVLSACQSSIVEEEDTREVTSPGSKHEEDTREVTSPGSKHEEEVLQTMANLHPLLKGDQAEGESNSTDVDVLPQQDVFSRIDASKLSSAIGNASVLGTLSHEGVDPLTLQAAALSMGQPQPEVKSVPKKKKPTKTTKPPPGPKAKVKFDFVADSEKELSLEKGTVIDLTEQIDDNWLKGEFQGKSGIFPISYVQVLTPEELSLLDADDIPLNKLARAKFDFIASSEKELSLVKGDVLTVLKDKDDNWFEVSVEDRVGIVPKSYVEIVELDIQ